MPLGADMRFIKREWARHVWDLSLALRDCSMWIIVVQTEYMNIISALRQIGQGYFLAKSHD